MPPLTSVRVSWQVLGSVAAEQVHRLLAGAAVERVTLVQPLGVTARASTARGLDDPLLRKALHHIERALPKGLSVVALARRLGVSGTTLRQRFRLRLGVPPHELILCRRLAKAQEMLIDRPDLDVEAVARAGGWCRRSHLAADFRRAFGMSPTVFRSSRARR